MNDFNGAGTASTVADAMAAAELGLVARLLVRQKEGKGGALQIPVRNAKIDQNNSRTP